jgi:hypothetical protein
MKIVELLSHWITRSPERGPDVPFVTGLAGEWWA